MFAPDCKFDLPNGGIFHEFTNRVANLRFSQSQMKQLHWILLAACIIAMRSVVAEPLFDEQSKVTIRVSKDKDGNQVTEQQKVNYTPMQIYPDNKQKRVIIRETYQVSESDGQEGTRSNAKIDLFFAGADGHYPKSPSRTIEIPNVHEAKFFIDHWKALTFGCCDSESYGRLYDYAGDKPFLRYNEDYWRMEVPNAHNLVRFAGLALRDYVPGDAAESAIFKSNKDAVACLSYAAPGKPLASLYIKPKRPENWKDHSLHSGQLSVASKFPRDEVREQDHLITLWSLDGADAANKGKTAVSGVTITAPVFVDDSMETVTVRVENDKFADAKVDGKLLEAMAGQ